MSFQHFRLGQLAMSQPLPPHLQQNQYTYPTSTTTKPSATRSPYGSGDSDDGYTLAFPNIAAFQEWRIREEETQMVEFVKGDTHGSKALPPRFKDHTKLVCARHSRSGRKKYVKKHPERVRKVPSRKLEGQGCQASISYKTYFDSDEVRVCYIAEHSHPVGLANLPYTRRGRRAAVEAEKAKSKRSVQPSVATPPSSDASTSSSSAAAAATASTQTPPPHVTTFPATPLTQLPHPFPHYGGQPGVNTPYPQMMPAPLSQNEQWERMSVLFSSIREHARAYEYPNPSVVALESVLIRLYLESPMGMMGGPGHCALGGSMHGLIPQQKQGQTSQADPHSQTAMGTGDSVHSEMDSSIESG